MQKQTSILLVDDHAMLRKGLRALIEQEPGLSVIEEAENGQEAIEKVRKLQPDVVVMDINMPRLNGIEATRQIFAENPDCRILALSIHSTRRYVEEMLEAGVAGYLLKESAPEELLAAIHALRDGKGYLSKDITELVIEKVRETAAAAATNGSRSDSRKWRKPELTDGLIHRRDLVLRLENEHHKFLTLLVAPAGYGKTTLVTAAQQLERCFTRFNSYNDGDCGIATDIADGGLPSNDGWYVITDDNASATTFRLVAAPQGTQADDTQCASLRLTHTGARDATGSAPGRCW